MAGELLADPKCDALQCVCLCISDDGAARPGAIEVAIVLEPPGTAPVQRLCVPGRVQVLTVPDEHALIEALVSAVRAYDPAIVLGFDVQSGSLGYLTERAAVLGGVHANLLRSLSRTPLHEPPGALRDDEYGRDHGAGIWCTGRVVLNFWRILRGEIKLTSYTYEAAMMAVLKRRVPDVHRRTLAAWWASPRSRWRTVDDVASRTRGCLLMCAQLDLVGRTSELARVFGIDFNSVLIRGSQYRVESMMLRLAHSQNFLALSPDKSMLVSSEAPTCIALVMEPQSGFYTSPVVVLDFQSLYPSQVIAYNLCYSTCLGRAPQGPARSLAGVRRKFGVTELALQPGVVPELVEAVHIAPNGALFAPPAVRPGVLPRLLSEILETRVMVKAALKTAPSSARVLQRCLTARQLGLKLIANVTYGYTAANFSGRMPLTDLADAIVSSGRATLLRAIAMVNAHPAWRAEVVYGDTDSMFVSLPGRSRAEAFRIGAEIAAAVTAANPKPVKLQMEKVYQPCILASKKRYVGMAYSSPAQAVPAFDAKGIETVRRDNCGIVCKTLERALRLLFASRDLSTVRAYLQRQWAKVLAGRVSVADAIIAKEVRLGTYAAERGGGAVAPGKVPPGAVVAQRLLARDPRATARYGRRVPYVVCEGAANTPLYDLVQSPHDFLNAPGHFRLRGRYYADQTVNALKRLINLAGGAVDQWFHDMRRATSRRTLPAPPTAIGAQRAQDHALGHAGRTTITEFYASDQCAVRAASERRRTSLRNSSSHAAAALSGVRHACAGRARAVRALQRRCAARCYGASAASTRHKGGAPALQAAVHLVRTR